MKHSETKILRQEEMVDFLKETVLCLGTLSGRLAQMQTNDRQLAQELVGRLFRLRADVTEMLDEQTAWLESLKADV